MSALPVLLRPPFGPAGELFLIQSLGLGRCRRGTAVRGRQPPGTGRLLGVVADGPVEHPGLVRGVAIVAGILSATTTPEADIRAWENLPRYLSFAALELPPGQHSLAVDFRDAGGRTLQTKTVTFTVPTNSSKDTVLFVSEHNS